MQRLYCQRGPLSADAMPGPKEAPTRRRDGLLPQRVKGKIQQVEILNHTTSIEKKWICTRNIYILGHLKNTSQARDHETDRAFISFSFRDVISFPIRRSRVVRRPPERQIRRD